MIEALSTWVAEKFLGGIFGKMFGKCQRMAADKRTLADEILQIVSEGEISGYWKEPENPAQKMLTINKLRGTEKEVAALLDDYLKNWSYLEYLRKKDTAAIGSSDSLEMSKETDEIGDKLKEIAHKWRE